MQSDANQDPNFGFDSSTASEEPIESQAAHLLRPYGAMPSAQEALVHNMTAHELSVLSAQANAPTPPIERHFTVRQPSFIIRDSQNLHMLVTEATLT